MSGSRTSRKQQTSDTTAASLDDIKRTVGGLLDDKLTPVLETQETHRKAINGLDDELAQHESRLRKIENKIDLVTGDSLGGMPVRLFGALVALLIGALLSMALGADDWKVLWWGLAWALIAYAFIQEIQIQLVMRKRHKTQDDESSVDNSTTSSNPDS